MKSSQTSKLKKIVSEMSTTDICLSLLMGILLFQQVYTVFFITPVSSVDNSIDIILRTSLASVFGYIISANFAIGKKSIATTPDAPANTSTQAKSPIGFAADATQGDTTYENVTTRLRAIDAQEVAVTQTTTDALPPSDPLSPDPSASINPPATKQVVNSTQQVAIAASIGIVSLVVLIVYRNFVSSDNPPIAALTQLRDLVAASIGYLLGCPNTK